jgi:hypothetical protein
MEMERKEEHAKFCSKRTRPLERLQHGLKNSIKMDLKETGLKGVGYIHFTHDSVH